jgi:cytochrome c oxidase assembly protein subunit 15
MGGTRPGVRAEHGHRLIGAMIGVITILIVILAFTVKTATPALKKLTLVALVAVIVQGVMGGLRVTEISTTWAIIHGCFGQVFLCIGVGLVAMTSSRWPGRAAERDEMTTRAVRFWTIVLVLAVFGQLILGAILRHTNVGAGWHIMGALAVGVIMIMTSQHVYHPRPLNDASRTIMHGLFALYGLQIVLGLTTFLVLQPLRGGPVETLMQAYLPTAHVGVGAAILTCSFYLALQTRALTRRTSHSPEATTRHDVREVLA